MKHILKLILTLLISAPLCGAEPATHTYRGEVTGVMCAACSDHVKVALSKLPGVESVKVLHGENEGVNKLVIVSSKKDLTKDAANKALGGDSRTYNVTALQLVK